MTVACGNAGGRFRFAQMNVSAPACVSFLDMLGFLLWCVLFFFCWPLALFALVLYPIVWIILLPFRIVGIAFEGVFELLRAMFFLPVRLLGSRPR